MRENLNLRWNWEQEFTIFVETDLIQLNILFFRFSCDIVQVDNYGWNINGTFNGVMGLFQQKRIQMLSHATIMREDRLAAVEFTAEVFVIE